MMLKRFFTALLTVVAVVGYAQGASAQYIYLDANENGVSDTGDRLNPNGTPTTVDVFLRTNQNRDGSTAVCDTGPEPLTINQYQINLLAVGGVVTYSGFVNQQTSMPTSFGELNPDGVRYKNGFGGGTQLAAGQYRLCTLTITGVAGSPRIDIVDLVSGSQDFTGFGTSCLGRGFDNVYRLDGPNVPPATGDVGDFVDWDGLGAAGGPNQPPVVTNPGNRTTAELALLAFTVTATDPDAGQTVTWSLTLGTPAANGATINATTGAFSWTPTEAQGPGVFPVTVTATDNGAPMQSGSAGFTITVNEVNAPPVLAPIGNRTIQVGVPVTFTATATDADIPANTLTFSLDAGAPTGATIGASTGAFSWTPATTGPATVTIRVTDNGVNPPNLSDFEVVNFSHVDNFPPVLAAIGNMTVDELTTLTFTATATDPEGQTLTFSLDAGAPAGATINGSTGAFGWTPTEAQGPSNYPITVRVTDNGTPTQSDFEAITVTVNEVNRAPVLAPIGNKTVSEGTQLCFTVTATDPDIPANTLTCSITGAPPGVMFNGSTGQFCWTPNEAQGDATYTMTICCTDNGAPPLQDCETFTITVLHRDEPPVLAPIGNKTVQVNVPLTFTATATDPDIPANTLTFSLDAGAPAGATINPSTGAFSWTPTMPGTFPVTIRVTDNGVPPLSDFEAITITVIVVDGHPVLAPIGNKTVDELIALTFTATATDPDGQTLTFSLGAGAPAGATINVSTGAFSWTPTEAQGPGIFPITVLVTDNGTPPQSDSETIQVTVNEVNTAPVLGPIGNKTVDEGTQICFTVTTTDGDTPANTITCSISDAPLGATFNASTGQFCWTPTEAQGPGVYTMTICCTDNGTPPLQDCETFTITVNEVNADPTADAGGPYEGSVNADINFDGTGSFDPDGDPLTYDWTFGDGSTGTGVTTVHAYAAEGTFSVTLRVADPAGLYDDDATTATIRAVIGAQVILENNGTVLDARKTGNRKTTIGLEQMVLPNTDLDPSSIRISHLGPPGFVTECAADARSIVTGDMDGDGIPDLDVRFTNKCLANLFNDVPDNSVQTIVITGEFTSAGGTVPLHAERDATIRVKHRDQPILVVASPNPFNPETVISYSVTGEGPVTLRIYSVDGRLVRTLKRDEATAAGSYDVTWNGTDDRGQFVPSAIYFVRTTQRTGGAEESAVIKVAVTK